MMPTLLQGDYIFVKKYSYGLRWPVIEKKFYETGSPQRGDVVVATAGVSQRTGSTNMIRVLTADE